MRRRGPVIATRGTCDEGEGIGKAGQVKAEGKERPFAWQVDIRWWSWIIHIWRVVR